MKSMSYKRVASQGLFLAFTNICLRNISVEAMLRHRFTHELFFERHNWVFTQYFVNCSHEFAKRGLVSTLFNVDGIRITYSTIFWSSVYRIGQA